MNRASATQSPDALAARESRRAIAPRARILLVDDDERNLLALSEVLEPLADVVTATSGRLALRELLKDDFAVILLDVFMPEMDGYETAALIRQRSPSAKKVTTRDGVCDIGGNCRARVPAEGMGARIGICQDRVTRPVRKSHSWHRMESGAR